MDPLIRDLRHAFTRLIRDRGFAVVTMVTLALGIGANTAVFSLVKAALLSPLPYGDAERLTVIWGPDRAEATHLSRSEEHTSELQSPRNLVCRLLLEKKQNKAEYRDERGNQ